MEKIKEEKEEKRTSLENTQEKTKEVQFYYRKGKRKDGGKIKTLKKKYI